MALNALFHKYDRLFLFDTETTGLDFQRDEIIEFAAVVVEWEDGKPVVREEYDELIAQGFSNKEALENIIIPFDEINITNEKFKVQRAYRVKGGTIIEFQEKEVSIPKKYLDIYNRNVKIKEP